MARGAPDYSNVKSDKAIYTMLDLGELAPRLGSIDVFDRSGNLVWMDDFEAATINWITAGDGTANSVTISSAQRLRGSNAGLLTCGSDGGMYAEIYRYLPIPNESHYSLELAFAADADVTFVFWMIQYAYNNVMHVFTIRYNIVTQILSYFDNVAPWVDFATGVNILTLAYIFHVGKLTVDLQTGKYKQFRLDQNVYDLTDLPGQSTAMVTQDWFIVLFEAVGKPAVNAKCYVDNCLVKQNEP